MTQAGVLRRFGAMLYDTLLLALAVLPITTAIFLLFTHEAITPGGSGLNNFVVLDVRIEYEFEGDEPVCVCIGDSITSGWTSDSSPMICLTATSTTLS